MLWLGRSSEEDELGFLDAENVDEESFQNVNTRTGGP